MLISPASFASYTYPSPGQSVGPLSFLMSERLTPQIIDFTGAELHVPERSLIVSANLGKALFFEGKIFYVKDTTSFLPISQELANAIASREAVSAEIYRLFGRAPETIMVNHCGLVMGGTDNDKIYIASRWVDYQDFGDWMIKETSADKLEMQFSEFTTENIAAFKENAAAASALTLELAVLREQHRDPSRQPWWEEKGGNPNLDLIEKYRPLAEELDKVMQKQFFLLPEVLQKEIQEHLVISQLLGDWDPINPFYKNMGVVEDEWGELHIMRLDFGSCLDVGFRGQAKEHGYHMAVNQRPAVFPELKHIFKEENAPFSEVLPKLGEAFDNLPYADYAKSISGNPEWAEFTRLKIAYRCVLLRQADKNIIADIIRRNLIDEPGSIAGLKTKESLIDVMNARIEALILQCGGLEKIDEFERNHQDVANSIRESVLSALQDHGQSFG